MPSESTFQEAISAEFVIATSESIPEQTETPGGNSQNPTPHSKSASQKNKQQKSAQPEPAQPEPAQPEPNREAFWRATIQKRVQSGLNILEFCKQEKLSESAYHHWKRKIAGRDGKPLNRKSKKKTATKQNKKITSKPTFIPVALDPAPTLHPQVEILYASGTTVRIASGCDEKTVSLILKAMETQTC